MTQTVKDSVRKAVRKQYGKVAKSGQTGCGCTTSCCGDVSADAKTAAMKLGYSRNEINDVPDGANMGLGCGNPQAIAEIKPGDTVLDLGSGGGFDCFLAAKAVGGRGHVIGVDMTAEMISKARQNAQKAGYENVEFRLGEIENLPVADASVDVIISNCVINLSPEKLKVFQEAFRVLKPGGRLAVSDIIATADIPEQLKNDMALLTSCMSGASTVEDIRHMLTDAGFTAIEIKAKNESKSFIKDWEPDRNIEEYVTSATIEALKA